MNSTESRLLVPLRSRGGPHADAESRERARNAILIFSLTLYATLWIFEGAIRKWVPGSESAFYFVRDILLILGLVAVTLRAPTTKGRALGVVFWGIAFTVLVGGLLQAVAQHFPPAVAVAGARAMILPWLPLYIVWRYQPPAVWRRLSTIILVAAPVEALLTIMQSTSPAAALINRQIGDESAYFTTAFGIVRGTGTFSSPLGLTLFAALCLAMALAELAQSNGRRWLAVSGIGSSAAILLLGGSRSALLAAAIVLVVFLARSVLLGGLRGVGVAVAVLAVASAAAYVISISFPQVLEAFNARIENASDSGNIDGRLIGNALGFLSFDLTDFGNGLGGHSQIGVALGSGQRWFEDENTRWVAELGVAGYLLAIVRIAAGVVAAIWVLVRLGSLPIYTVMAAASLLPVILYGGITTQPTSQGFVGVATAILASAMIDRKRARSS